MKKITLIFLVCVLSLAKGQKRNNVWMVGGATASNYPKTRVDFDTGSFSADSVFRYMNFFLTNASICDTVGNLLFYTNGDFIADANNGMLPNSFNFNPTTTGDSTFGSNGCQSVLILPRPEHSNEYYVFHVNGENFNARGQSEFQPLHLWYSVIDKNLNGGMGDIIAGKKTVPVIEDTLTWGRITSCKHANGRDWWLIMHRYYSDLYYNILVTADSMIVYQQNIGDIITSDIFGAACFDPAGEQYVMLNPDNKLDILNFDRCIGQFSIKEQITVPTIYSTLGATFSPSGRFLYVYTNINVFQYDTWASPIASSIDTIATWDTLYSPLATYFFTGFLAPDNKIYITTFQGTDKFHVINDPDILGSGCNLVQNQITLPTRNAACLPNTINYDLGSVTGSVCDSITSGIFETQFDNLISVSPNPAVDYYWINYDTKVSDVLLFEVFDVNGQLVEKRNLYGTFKSLRVDCSNYSSGVYLYRVSRGSQSLSSGRLVVN